MIVEIRYVALLTLACGLFALNAGCAVTRQIEPASTSNNEVVVETGDGEKQENDSVSEAKGPGMEKAVVEAGAQAVLTVTNMTPVLAMECTLNAGQMKISCHAIGYQMGSQLRWTSTGSWANSGGGQWSFTIHEELIAPSTDVSLEECIGSSCQMVKISIDTSQLVSKNPPARTADVPSKKTSPDALPGIPTHTGTKTVTPTPSINLEPLPLLILPFTIDHEPTGMMPMGETVQHAREAPWGHPGIDFQWSYKAPLIIALDGEVVQIIPYDSEKHGLTEYSVLVISNEFIVNYEVIELYSANPSLEVGSQVVAGQVIGYAIPVGAGDGWHMIHWAFGTHRKNEDLKPNPEGVVMLHHTKYLCPVPYFTKSERQRLSRIWEIANYNERSQFPDLCNGPYKNY